MAVDLFEVGRARFGVLAGEAADADHRLAGALDEHEAHLDEHFQLVGDAARVAVGEAFGAVAALKHKAAAGSGLGEVLLEGDDLPAGDERRQRCQLAQDPLQRLRIGVFRLLEGREPPPRIRRPVNSHLSIA